MGLIDLFLPLFICAISSIKNQKITATQLRKNILNLHATAIECAHNLKFPEVVISSATFATFICLDEIILCSDHHLTLEWRGMLLQNETTCQGLGGVIFFEHLNNIKENEGQLRILFIFCLLIGYKGRYVNDGTVALDILINQEINKLPHEFRNYFISNDYFFLKRTITKRNVDKKINNLFIFSLLIFLYVLLNCALAFNVKG
jgi:type VI secretion system protein ImpK